MLWQFDRQGTTLRNQSSYVDRVLNQSIAEFREAVSDGGNPYFLRVYTGSLSTGPTSPYHFGTVDLSSLNPVHQRIYGFDIQVANVWVSLDAAAFRERNDVQRTLATGASRPLQFFQFDRTSIAYAPASDSAYPFQIWYLPVHTDLVADGDTFDGINGWEDWVVFNAGMRLMLRDRDEHLERFEAERQRILTRILHVAKQAQKAGALVRGGQRGFDRWRGPGHAGPFFWGAGGTGSSLNEPGSGEVGRLAVATSGGKLRYVAGAAEGDVAAYAPDATSPSGFSFAPRRHFIRPDIDTTGVVDASAEIQRALNSRAGACVELPDGYINIAAPISIPDGATLLGSPQSMREGALCWSPPKGGTTGSMILATDPSKRKLFTFNFNSQAIGLGIHYPLQKGAYDPRSGTTQADGTPDAYDWTFYMDSKFGCAIENCYVTNPYQMAWINNTQGAHIDYVRGWPLFRGIKTGLVYDVLRISRVHFNQNALASNLSAPLLTAAVLASGVGILIDGCDDFQIDNCYLGNYQFGIWLNDADGDSHLSYGNITDTGIECVTCMVVDLTSFHGVRVLGASWSPNTGGHGLKVQDTLVPASAFYRPNIELYGVRIGGGTQYARGIWATSTSHAVITMWGGGFVNYQQYAFATDGANAIIKYNDVKVPASPLGGSAVTNGGTGISGTTITV